jgi:hypothetical protein
MIDKWNEFLDYSQNSMTKLSKDYQIKTYINDFRNLAPVNNTLKFLETSEYTWGLYVLVKNANNYKTCNFGFLGKNYQLTYQDRRRLTVYPCYFLAMVCLLKKSGGLGKIFLIYLQTSALLCRENFDLRNYKLKAN